MIDNFQFRPGDVIVYKFAGGYGLLNPLVNKLLHGWGHVGLFYDWTKRDLPLTIESIGWGVRIRTLLVSNGCKVAVLRWRGGDKRVGLAAAKAAERLADNPESWYGYFDIPRFVVPRLIWAWLTGRREGFGYERNPHFICSELVAEAFWQAGCDPFPTNCIPLPHDFIDNYDFDEVWRGKLQC